MTVELFPRAEADIIRQFRYYLVDKGDPATAFRFPEAVSFEVIRIYYSESPDRLRVVRILHGSRNVRQILRSEKPVRD